MGVASLEQLEAEAHAHTPLKSLDDLRAEAMKESQARQDARSRLTDAVVADRRIEEFLLGPNGLTEQGVEGQSVDELTRLIETHPDPDEFRAKLANSMFFADTYEVEFSDAFNVHDTIVAQAWGEGVSAKSAYRKIAQAHKDAYYAMPIQRKGVGQTTRDAITNTGLRALKQLAGHAQMVPAAMYSPAVLWSKLLGFEWPDRLREWGENMTRGANAYYRDHPEVVIQAKGDGYWETTKSYITHPEAIYQGTLEAVPMLLEAYIGHITGVKAAKIIGKAPKFLPWMGRVQGIALPIVGETYADLRYEGVDPKVALPQAFLTGEIEGLIEEWTISRKLAIFKGSGQIARRGIRTAVIRGLLGTGKAYARGAGEEFAQGVNRNFWNMIFNDSEQKLLDGVMEEAAAGGLIELTMSGAFAAAGQVRGRRLVSKDEKLGRIEVVRDIISKAELTPEDRTEITEELDRKKAEVEAEKAPTIPIPPAEPITPAEAVPIAPEAEARAYFRNLASLTADEIKALYESKGLTEETSVAGMQFRVAVKDGKADNLADAESKLFNLGLTTEQQEAYLREIAELTDKAKAAKKREELRLAKPAPVDYAAIGEKMRAVFTLFPQDVLSDKRRNSLIKELTTLIQQHPTYLSAVDALEQQRGEIDVGFYYVPENLKGEVYTITGKPGTKGFNFRLARMFTFETGTTATAWTKAVQIAFGSDAEMDITEFVRRVQVAMTSQKRKWGLNEAALENALKQGDLSFDFLAELLEQVIQGRSATELRARIAEWQEGYERAREVAAELGLAGEIESAERYGFVETAEGTVVVDWETQQELSKPVTRRKAVNLMNEYNTGKRVPKAEPVAPLMPSEVKTVTIRQLLNSVMKGMSKASQKAFMDGAREVVATHRQLTKYAKERLKGLDITQGQRSRLLAHLTKHRTQAEKVAAIAAVEAIAEKAQYSKAVAALRKTVAYINKKAGRTMQERGIRPEYMERIKELTDSFVFKPPSEKTRRAVASLKKHLDNLQTTIADKYHRAYAEELLPQKLIDQVDKVNLKSLADMTAEEVTEIDDVLKMLVHLNRTKNRIILQRTARDSVEILNGALAELDNVVDNSVPIGEQGSEATNQKTGFVRGIIQWSMGVQNHDLETLIDTITGGQQGIAHETIVEGFASGRRTQAEYLNSIWDYVRSEIASADITVEDLQRLSPSFLRWFKEGKAKQLREFLKTQYPQIKDTPKHRVTIGDTVVQMTMAEMMSVYMHAQARYNLKEILRSGIAFRNRKLGRVTVDQISNIVKRVEANPKAIKLCQVAAHVYENMSKPAINRTSQELRGIDLAKEPNYWHIPPRYTGGKLAGIQTYRVSQLEAQGWLQPRVGGINPIVIYDFFESFNADAQSVSEYVGMAKPYRAAKTMFNYKLYREKIRNLGYEKQLKNIDTLITRTEQRPIDRTALASVLSPMIGGLARAVLAEPGIMLGQYASTVGYFTEVDGKYISALRGLANKETIERYKAHWPMFKLRVEQGLSSKIMGDIGRSDRTLRAISQKRDFLNVLTQGIHYVDSLAVTEAGRITEAEMADENLSGKSLEYWQNQGIDPLQLDFESPAYWEAFNKRADYLVRRTQPMFYGENRSVLTSEPTAAAKMFFMFRSYVDQPLRIMARANTARKNNLTSRSEWAQQIGIVWAGLGAYAVMRHLVAKLIYRDDDDWADLIYEVAFAPVRLFAVVGYLLQEVGRRAVDAALGKKPPYWKVKLEPLPLRFMRELFSAMSDYSEAVGYLATGERYQSGPRRGQLKSLGKFEDGTIKLIENSLMLVGIPAQIPVRMFRGWLKEEKSGGKITIKD